MWDEMRLRTVLKEGELFMFILRSGKGVRGYLASIGSDVVTYYRADASTGDIFMDMVCIEDIEVVSIPQPLPPQPIIDILKKPLKKVSAKNAGRKND